MKETTSFKVSRAITLTLLTIFTVLPTYVLIITAFKPLTEIRGTFTWWPQEFTIAPFIDMWSTVPLGQYFLNSVIVCSIATACSVLIAILAGYAIARMQFRGKRVFSLSVLSTQMFPGILFLLPLFLLFTQLGRLTGIQFNGSLLGLVLTYLTFTLPFAIWMLSGYFAAIPDSLEEAAMLDGLTRIQALFRIIIPISRPGIVAVAVYAFINSWGEVLFASVITNNATRTLAVGLQSYATETNVQWNELMAASLVTSLPILLAFLFVQKHLVAGLTAGAVK
jgi:multiple sugar transport system permease protein